MTISVSARSLRVALDAAVAPSRAEVVYVLTTLLEIAGYSAHFSWAPDATSPHGDGEIDIYYGPRDSVPARLSIASVRWPFSSAPQRDATSARVSGALDVLLFPGEPAATSRAGRLEHDIIFASYWLLTGAPEPKWPRSRWDDLQAEGSLLVQNALLARAPVSRYAMHLRRLFESLGVSALRWPWEQSGPGAAFAFTHDVDYPQIIRWIEIPRELLRGRPRLAWGIATGRQHFWRFRDWIDLTRRFGTRPTFYFMARRGSLLDFAAGTPDAFYDVAQRPFRELFAELKDAGAEIGLHASYRAHRSADVLRQERERIEQIAQVKVWGNRHHYWHLDPADPNETLRRHELAGFVYDSSLGLEYYPGWRRGICHPFRPFHPGERRAIETVQLPPAWMDDHFDRRRLMNQIADPDAAAKALLDNARALGGTCVVDYHARGMNADFFPHYGPWLARFADREFATGVSCFTAAEIATAYRQRAAALHAASRDETLGSAAWIAAVAPSSDLGPAQTSHQA